MCTQLKIINNRSRRYRPLFSRGELNVPCGCCPECQSGAQDDWFLRTWQNIKTYNDAGGKCIFFTATYRNEDLPIFTDVELNYHTGEIQTFQIPCFNKLHKDKFIHDIVQFFERRGVNGENSLGIKFIWPSEYGQDERFTHRPHYHPILFIPPEAIDERVLGFDPNDEQKWKELINRYWKYGMVRYSRPEDGGIFVEKEFAPRYVTKYVVKDVDWYSQPELNEYLYDDKGQKIPERYERIKKFLPKHWQSKSFGEGLVAYCMDDKVFRDGIDFDFIQERRSLKSKRYRVPRYIERKLLYTTDSQGSLVLNDRGKRVKREILSFDYKLEKLVEHNSHYIQYINTNYQQFEDSGLNVDLLKLLHGHSLRYFGAWQLTFSGTCIPDYEFFDFGRFNLMSDDDFCNYCRDLYNLRIEGYKDDDILFDIGFSSFKRKLRYHTPEESILFHDFQILNNYLMTQRHRKSVDAYNKYFRDKLNRKLLKKLVA